MDRITLKLILIVWCSSLCSGDNIAVFLEGGNISKPSDVAFENSNTLWIVNYNSDSFVVVSLDSNGNIVSKKFRQDVFAEHFMEYPSAIAFDTAGSGYFATVGESKNCVRNMTFIQNPERNYYFKCNFFTGPSLWHVDTFAMTTQNKEYKGDWLAPGPNHNNYTHPPLPTEEQEKIQFCEAQKNENACRNNVYCHWYWNSDSATYTCNVFHTEGSHMDMLHESPFAVGIAHHNKNQYWVFDGYGHGNEAGHLVFYDFNEDHGPGSTYHSDGIVRRYLDVTLKRVTGVHSGMVLNKAKSWLYIADTGNNRVIRVNTNTGTAYQWLPSFYEWEDYMSGGQGTGINRYDSNATGSEPGSNEIAEWIRTSLNKTNEKIVQDTGKNNNFDGNFIAPLESLVEYSAVLDVVQEVLITDVSFPSGLVIVEEEDVVLLYVAEQSGSIYLFKQSSTLKKTWNKIKTYQTNSTRLMGLTISSDNKFLYAADAANDRVLKVTLNKPEKEEDHFGKPSGTRGGYVCFHSATAYLFFLSFIFILSL